MKKVSTLLSLLFVTLVMTAKPISPSMAREAAQRFLQAKGCHLKSEALRAPRRAMAQDIAASAYYVFNASDNKGFVVVSGDDCVGDNLVLGYTTQGSFHADAVPANMQWWLDNTEQQMAVLMWRPCTTTWNRW